MANFSRGAYTVLPTNNADLTTIYDGTDLTNVGSDNSVYVNQAATSPDYAVHQAKWSTSAPSVDILWNGQTDLAPSSSVVKLQVYKVAAPAGWVDLDSDNTTGANADFDLSYNGLATADYLDTGVITFRVYQAASTEFTVNIGENSNCNYSGCEDGWFLSGNPTFNYGGSTIMQATGDTTQVGLIKFSGLSNIPTGATITAASLFLYDHDSSGGDLVVTLRRLLRDWVVGTQNGADRDNDTPDSSCWNEYGSHNVWTTAGALSNGNDRSSTTTYTATLTTNTGWHELTSAQLIADVQNMVSTPANNFGWHIDGTDGAHSGNAIRFSTSQDGTATLRPYLVVTYTV